MTKAKRRILFVTGAAILLTATVVLCVFLLRPKMTIASLMGLDSPDQIVKIELAEFRFGADADNPDPAALSFQRVDITDLEWGREYRDAVFSMEVSEYEREACLTSSDIMGKSPDFWAVMLTVEDDGASLSGTRVYYLPVEMMRGLSRNAKIDSYGVLYYKEGNSLCDERFFSLPDSRLFNKDFIQNEISIVKSS